MIMVINGMIAFLADYFSFICAWIALAEHSLDDHSHFEETIILGR